MNHITTEQTPLQLIKSGALDDQLNELENAIRHRRQSTIYSLKTDQSVWINTNAHPKYLIGRRCIVQQVNRVRVVVRLVRSFPGERFQGNFTCPVSLISASKPTYAVD